MCGKSVTFKKYVYYPSLFQEFSFPLLLLSFPFRRIFMTLNITLSAYPEMSLLHCHRNINKKRYFHCLSHNSQRNYKQNLTKIVTLQTNQDTFIKIFNTNSRMMCIQLSLFKKLYTSWLSNQQNFRQHKGLEKQFIVQYK